MQFYIRVVELCIEVLILWHLANYWCFSAKCRWTIVLEFYFTSDIRQSRAEGISLHCQIFFLQSFKQLFICEFKRSEALFWPHLKIEKVFAKGGKWDTIQNSVSIAKSSYSSMVDKTLNIRQINTIMNLQNKTSRFLRW